MLSYWLVVLKGEENSSVQKGTETQRYNTRQYVRASRRPSDKGWGTIAGREPDQKETACDITSDPGLRLLKTGQRCSGRHRATLVLADWGSATHLRTSYPKIQNPIQPGKEIIQENQAGKSHKEITRKSHRQQHPTPTYTLPPNT